MKRNCECKFDGFELVRCETCLEYEKFKEGLETEPTEVAGSIMEDLLENRFYQRMKMAEDNTKAIKKTLREQLESHESKRHEFKNHNLVAKFVAKKVANTDYEGLNEFLNDIGLLVPTVKLNHKDIKKDALLLDAFSPYQLEQKYKLHIAFNKEGKLIKQYPTQSFEEQCINELIDSYSNWNSEHKRLVTQYEETKIELLACPILKKEKKVSHKYGSVSRVALDPEYNISQIYDELGADFLIRYGKPDSEKLQEFVYKGLLSQKDIDQFKQVIDIRLDFIVLTLDAEERMLSMLHNKKMIAAQNRRIG
ncbi:hypothetical protein [Alkalihalobacillus sp. BA299]|uniref:hypothetical protein n=1 Tax=Alkalihalobacillus sp. BA299 TaxID=2815938 RepID=UPI001ADCD8DA|nr:hypothetical protein [Alkalihalobacillus sp. BA299]